MNNLPPTSETQNLDKKAENVTDNPELKFASEQCMSTISALEVSTLSNPMAHSEILNDSMVNLDWGAITVENPVVQQTQTIIGSTPVATTTATPATLSPSIAVQN